ncbi:MAG: glycosyltransferase family 2 protein [Streptococcaceae bacterium]|jgi:glycosyltransferase involved in cell wall biosynthesis|nr:glycosyltransferase family 2 protein [Streptococcaceae bacterium]
MCELKIFTPTYNRAKELVKLKDSLEKQTDQRFEWLIIDDGSVDETKAVVEEWIKTSSLNIRYIYQKNGGKHTAFNRALDEVEDYLNVCVDSDDWVTEDMVARVLADDERNWNDETIYAYAYANAYGIPSFSVDKFPQGIKTKELSMGFLLPGVKEIVRVYKPRILKGIRFPVYAEEPFMPESALLLQVTNLGDILFFSKPIVLGEYLPNGLSSKFASLILSSPKAHDYIVSKKMENATYSFRGMFQTYYQGEAYNMKLKRPLFKALRFNGYAVLALPFAVLFYLKKYFGINRSNE